jgi:exosortase
MNRGIVAWLVFLGLLWIPTIAVMELEWRLNEQYNYGYFVPVFVLYLVYLRWQQRPDFQPAKVPVFYLIAGCLSLIPVHMLQSANPDWRLVYWLLTLQALVLTLLASARIAGWRASWHFAPALIMILFSVPWITTVENRVTSALMEWVALFTVEVVNLMGIYAVRLGNVIQLPNAMVGVEEACSGVRSLQSSLMAGYLFGELMQLRFFARGLLIGLGVIVTFVFNLGRTLGLTFITHYGGKEGYDAWHDHLGNAVAIVGFFGVGLIAWLLARLAFCRSGSTPEPVEAEVPKSSASGLFPSSPWVLLCCLILAGFAADWAWYASAGRVTARPLMPAWENGDVETESLPIDPITIAQLKYTEGAHHQWREADGTGWIGFYFYWDAGRISSHAGVHRPENCLPSSGLRLLRDYGPKTVALEGSSEISFDRILFRGFNAEILVFFAVWDQGGSRPKLSSTWKDRIDDVWERRRVHGRHSLEFITDYRGDLEESTRLFERTLKRLYPAYETSLSSQ